jgi:hypothetical protein
MNNDVKLLAEAYELILEKKGKGKDWVPPWAKKEDEKDEKGKKCKDNQKKEKAEKGGIELTAKQKKLPPALQAAMKKKMTKKEKVAESFERLYEDFWNYFED